MKHQMKRLAFISLLLVFTAPTFSQEPDSVFARYGFLFDYTGSLIDQVGFKYRFSRDFSVTFRGSFSIQDEDSNLPSSQPSRAGHTVTTDLTAELGIFKLYDVQLFVLFGGGYDFSRSEYHNDNLTMPYTETSRNVIYSISAGLGAEYFLTRMISLSTYQSAEVLFTKRSVTHPVFPESENGRLFRIGRTKFSLTIYF